MFTMVLWMERQQTIWVTAGKFIVGNITRSNNLINAAGTYTDVLVPSSFSADNYDINTISGDFTIVPADQLIFKITAVSNVKLWQWSNLWQH